MNATLKSLERKQPASEFIGVRIDAVTKAEAVKRCEAAGVSLSALLGALLKDWIVDERANDEYLQAVDGDGDAHREILRGKISKLQENLETLMRNLQLP